MDAVLDVAGIDLHRSFRVLTMLPGDPTLRLEPGRLRRATITPDGPGSIDIRWAPGGTEANVTARGAGGQWLAARAADLCGCNDAAESFQPEHRAVRDLWRRHIGMRVIRTGTLWHDLAWWVVQQRIARNDAADQWQRLVRTYGSVDAHDADLRHPPEPQSIARLAYHELHGLGIERRRAEHLIAAARVVDRLPDIVDRPFADVEHVLRAVEGVGAWTASGLAAVTWGDADAVIVGDSGIPGMVAWALAGEHRADDARMLELLEPFRPHRYRVIKLAFEAGVRPPRRHQRLASPDIRRR